ncbi:Hypothetical predicted protein [Olea europaea subsp. europaea]|uniref:Uncharacterized protein n=1 Tax=Olea europaea subsp. europaea TaxID=158383 RepID=A0A8S0TQW3_OLEEU|nr:Hypothetical predicted protein [Olea europaea subsp. europaea]
MDALSSELYRRLGVPKIETERSGNTQRHRAHYLSNQRNPTLKLPGSYCEAILVVR